MIFGQTQISQSERAFLLHGGRMDPALGEKNPDMVYKTHLTKEKPVWTRYFVNENFFTFPQG